MVLLGFHLNGMTRPDNLTTQKVFIHNCINSVILLAHFYHYFQYLPFEIRFCWKHQNSVTKWGYLLSRYGGLLAQIANVVFFGMTSSSHSIPRRWCTGWLFFQFTTGRLLWLLVEITLLQRVLNMYKEDWIVRWFLVGLVAFCTVATTVVGTISTLAVNVQGACRIHTAPLLVTVLALGCLIPQCVIWTFAYRRRQSRHSILTRVIRDGNRGLVFLIALLVFIAINNIISNFSHRARIVSSEVYQVSYPVLITSMTWLNCYLIKHITKRSHHQSSHSSSSIDFPSTVSTSDLTSSGVSRIEFTTVHSITSEITADLESMEDFNIPRTSVANGDRNGEHGIPEGGMQMPDPLALEGTSRNEKIPNRAQDRDIPSVSS